MITIYNTQIEKQTALPLSQRKALTNFFNRQNIEIQIDIFKEVKNQFFKLKSKFDVDETSSLSAFYLANQVFYQKEQLLKKKNKSQDLTSLAATSEFCIKQFKKNRIKPKKEKLLNLKSVIKKLKEENYSYREMSQYFLSRHRFPISHTYIRKIWEEIDD